MKRKENLDTALNQDKEFLKNIGFTNKTNELLHLKSKIINQRYRDSHIIKDLDKITWNDIP